MSAQFRAATRAGNSVAHRQQEKASIEWSADESDVRPSPRPMITASATTEPPNEQAEPLQGLSTLAAVAAGVAHEVNNPLAYVLTNLDFVREQFGQDCNLDVVAALEEARLGALRIGAIVRNLQILVADESRVVEVDLAEVVESACMIVQSEVTVGAKIVRVRAWSPRIAHNASRVAYMILKMLMFMARGTSRLERSTLRVSTGTDDQGAPMIEMEGFTEQRNLPSIEQAMAVQGLDGLAVALSATLHAEHRNGATVLRLAFPESTRLSIGAIKI
jgi:C4-dicarboxylate-specific signal transduction histidine kinase